MERRRLLIRGLESLLPGPTFELGIVAFLAAR